MAARVHIVRTGTANIASVMAAVQRLGAIPELISDAQGVADAEHLVLPGVGAFGACMAELRQLALVDALRARVGAGRPTLAVCMGLQLFCVNSEETPGVPGIGVVQATLQRFTGDVRVPQLGWNRVEPDSGCKIIQAGYAYFAHSYRLLTAPVGWQVARTDHGGPYISALERGPVVFCQFHPELSGAFGQTLLRRWLEVR